MKTVKRIAVLGAGDMGHGIAALALTGGYEVCLRDLREELLVKARSKIAAALDKRVSKGRLIRAEADDMLQNRLHTHVDLGEAVHDADLVIEAIPEILPLKVETFRQLDRLTPEDAILASNSSTMSITAMAEATARPSQVLGLHFFNPPLAMKLVEVVRTEYTCQDTAEFALSFCRGLGKVPVVARKDTPGFIANRVGAPTAAYLSAMLDVERLEAGEVDAAMKKAGLPMGTCLLLDYTGLDLCVSTQAYYAEKLGPDYAAPQAVKDLVAAGRYGKKTGRGFYDWTNGMPQIDVSLDRGRYDPLVVTMLQANEAGKLVDQGVCAFSDVDIAMKCGYNYPAGPIEQLQGMAPGELVRRLEALCETYGKEIFRPAQSIRSGWYRS